MVPRPLGVREWFQFAQMRDTGPVNSCISLFSYLYFGTWGFPSVSNKLSFFEKISWWSEWKEVKAPNRWERKWKLLSCVRLFATPWTMEFSRPEYWSGEPFPSAGDLPNPGIEPRSPALQEDSLQSEPPCCCYCWVASVVSDSVRPHRQQPIRLPVPGILQAKNTGVGSHFLLLCW